MKYIIGNYQYTSSFPSDKSLLRHDLRSAGGEKYIEL
jgi:hypothetical protein